MNQPSMQSIRHFIWDFDGTLFDTYPIIIQNVRSALAEHGCDADPVECMQLMLNTIPAARNHYADKYGIDRAVLTEAYNRYHRQANEALAAPLMPGAAALLRHICEKGGKNYIFTHRKLVETKAYLAKNGVLELFSDFVGPESPCFATKPAPDAVLWLMQQHGMHTDDTVMVGDREIDLGSGRNAGVKAAHLVCTVAPETLKCDWRFESLAEMQALV